MDGKWLLLAAMALPALGAGVPARAGWLFGSGEWPGLVGRGSGSTGGEVGERDLEGAGEIGAREFEGEAGSDPVQSLVGPSVGAEAGEPVTPTLSIQPQFDGSQPADGLSSLTVDELADKLLGGSGTSALGAAPESLPHFGAAAEGALPALVGARPAPDRTGAPAAPVGDVGRLGVALGLYPSPNGNPATPGAAPSMSRGDFMVVSDRLRLSRNILLSASVDRLFDRSSTTALFAGPTLNWQPKQNLSILLGAEAELQPKSGDARRFQLGFSVGYSF